MAQNRSITDEELQRVRDWADAKIATGAEPPWAWYQLMKLRETLDAILAGMEATMRPLEGSPESQQRSGSVLRLVVCNNSPDSAPRHSVDQPVQLPM